jgi:murein hydrolase activator
VRARQAAAAALWVLLGAGCAQLQAAQPSPPSRQAEASARNELTELRQKIEGLQKKLAGAEEIKSEAADALRESERAISDANRRLFEIAGEKQTVNAELSKLSGESSATEARVREHQTRLGRLLERRYRAGDPDPLRLALSGDNPAEAARLLHYYGYLQRGYLEAIAALRAELARLASLAGEKKKKGAELAALESAAEHERGRLQTERGRHQAVLERVSKEIEYSRRQIVTLRRDEDRLTRLVEQIARVLAERERARAAQAAKAAREAAARDAARARAATKDKEGKPPERQAGRDSPPGEGAAGPARSRSGEGAAPLRSERLPEPGVPAGAFAAMKGRLALPVAGEIANRFGQPRAEGGIEWRGITIQARAGQEVRSVAPGRVVFADWLRGFGNLLIVDHGDGYMSLYGNNESLLRRVGDGVRGGDPVATVGATGGSSQPGLYFELRHQGRPFDPLAWAGLR